MVPEEHYEKAPVMKAPEEHYEKVVDAENGENDQVMPLPSEDKPQAADPGRTEPGKTMPKGPSEKGDDRLIKVKGLDKQQLCIDLLMVGCVQSFVDFFYITHRKSAPSESSPAEQEAKD